jgi:hypothetical protein
MLYEAQYSKANTTLDIHPFLTDFNVFMIDAVWEFSTVSLFQCRATHSNRPNTTIGIAAIIK